MWLDHIVSWVTLIALAIGLFIAIRNRYRLILVDSRTKLMMADIQLLKLQSNKAIQKVHNDNV